MIRVRPKRSMLTALGSSRATSTSCAAALLSQQRNKSFGYNKSVYRSIKNPGGSFMRWYYEKKYTRHTESKYHFPEVSKVTGEKIDWLYDTPKSGYEAAAVWGPNTIELKGMPMGHTPEYIQERLRRFFSKFGPIASCRAQPHPRDPYQCQGTAWVTFRTRQAVHEALRAPLIFPLSLHNKVVSMRDLDTDKTNDPDWIFKQKFWNEQAISVAKQLFAALNREGPRPLTQVWKGVLERDWVKGKGRVGKRGHADKCIYERFGGWEQFLTAQPFNELFAIEGGDSVHSKKVLARPLATHLAARVFVRAEGDLARQLHAVCSVNWREGKMALPEWTQERVDFWQHKPALPLQLQYQSRPKSVYKVFDEKLVLKLRRRRTFKLRQKLFRGLKLKADQEAALAAAQEEGHNAPAAAPVSQRH